MESGSHGKVLSGWFIFVTRADLTVRQLMASELMKSELMTSSSDEEMKMMSGSILGGT